MFEPSETPRVFGLAPGVDFPSALVQGLRARLAGQPPEAMARVTLIVNTRRMDRRLRAIFDTRAAGFLPRIRLVTDLDGMIPGLYEPAAIPPLKRRLELATLVSALLENAPELAPRTSLYALSDSLAALMDEMQSEGVEIEKITGLDVSDRSGHWARAQRFLEIAEAYLAEEIREPDKEERQRRLTQRILQRWAEAPPSHPVIIAGSTGSRGTTAMLMEAVARLPQGALVLPGFDFEMPTAVWNDLEQGMLSEDHPQYRFYHLMKRLHIGRGEVAPWSDAKPPSHARNRLVSLSLRPAPVTNTWLSEGKQLTDIADATAQITLLEAPTPRVEALTIALRLRKAVEDGQIAALITPDRMLTRQVTAALDRWGILPDDSAGTPLHLSPPGRFLRHTAALMRQPLDAEALLTLLKHPLTHSGPDRNQHQLFTQRFELSLRHEGLPFPDAGSIAQVAQRAAKRMEDPAAFTAWADWVGHTFCGHHQAQAHSLQTWVNAHLSIAQEVAAGQAPDAENELWRKQAGEKARSVMDSLAQNAPFGGQMTASEYESLVTALLTGEEVRDRDAPHPGVMIWGTLEARVQGADLVILGGLNDRTWPEAPAPDPWLNRAMRAEAGLLLPERRIGLSAHDYQQAVAAPEVWLTRSVRSDEAETVPSRWLNRLDNLMNGLPGKAGADAWRAMQDRGAAWLGQARALEQVTRLPPAHRPSPRPPVAARPRQLSVTALERLIRDPYAIYARYTLGLKRLQPLVQTPDAPLRGTVLHAVMERFIRETVADPANLSPEHLMQVTGELLNAQVPWPAARQMWRARIGRVAPRFVAGEIQRQASATPSAFEKEAEAQHDFPDIGFTLTARADRIDLGDEGHALLYDYKTGDPPGPNEQKHFNKQLLLQAGMIEAGAFKAIGPVPVALAAFIGMNAAHNIKPAPLDKEPPAKALDELRGLLARYLLPDQGFTSRRYMKSVRFDGDYDHLARYGEWDETKLPEPETLS